MSDAAYRDLMIRNAVPKDAEGITRTYMESAEFHAGLDPERYALPDAQDILTRYREGRQQPPSSVDAVTLIAELRGEIVGFVDVRLDQSPDPMHRRITYCHVVEIAVSDRHQHHGVGGYLLRAAEEWGQQRGAEFAILEYLAKNKRAGEFYQRMGYRAAAHSVVKRLAAG
jgi:GNAT superfamily N-acetyltransferase